MFHPLRLRHTIVMLLIAAAALASASEARAERSTAKEQYLIKATNEYRKSKGLRPLVTNARLTRAAIEHAQNMATKAILDHVLDGQGPHFLIMVRNRGALFFRAWAENIGYRQGYDSPEAEQMRGWQQSPGHNANLLKPNMTDIGVGAFRNAQGKWYFCQVFAESL